MEEDEGLIHFCHHAELAGLPVKNASFRAGVRICVQFEYVEFEQVFSSSQMLVSDLQMSTSTGTKRCVNFRHYSIARGEVERGEKGSIQECACIECFQIRQVLFGVGRDMDGLDGRHGFRTYV